MDNILWESRFALRTKGITTSLVGEILKFTQRREIISFAGALSTAEYCPAARFQVAVHTIANPVPTARLNGSGMGAAVKGSLSRQIASQPETYPSWIG